MDKDRFALRTSRDPNPLRPYYVPPSIGPTSSAAAATATTTAAGARHAGASSLSSNSTPARGIMLDLDLDLKASAGEAWHSTRSLFDTLVYRYTSVLLAQPFDVAKLVLQVSLPPSGDGAMRKLPSRSTSYAKRSATSSRSGSARGHTRDYSSDISRESGDDSDRSSDIPDYFTATAPRSRSPRKRRRRPVQDLSPSPTPTPRDRREQDGRETYRLVLKHPDSITHAISTIYQSCGLTGLWRATNCTFLYNALLRTTESFIRSLLLAILGLPEITGPDQSGLAPAISVPGSLGFSGIDLSDSPNVMGSLVVVGLASCIAGLLLAPLDLVRTRLIVTAFHHPPRGVLQNLRRLPSLLAPSSLWMPTIISHAVPQMFSAATPLVLRQQLRITPENAPSIWSIAAFTTCLTDLFLRLPLETVVRRAQVHTMRVAEPNLPLIIDAAPSYPSIAKTVYSIMYEEGETRTKDARGMVRVRKGQGIAGLVRGWRAGFWGLVGVWSAGALGPGENKGRGEF